MLRWLRCCVLHVDVKSIAEGLNDLNKLVWYYGETRVWDMLEKLIWKAIKSTRITIFQSASLRSLVFASSALENRISLLKLGNLLEISMFFLIYRESEDTSLLLLKEIYRTMNVYPEQPQHWYQNTCNTKCVSNTSYKWNTNYSLKSSDSPGIEVLVCLKYICITVYR